MPKRTLNDRMIRALKPALAGKRVDHMDAALPGFGVRVTDKGAKSFILVARYPGSANPTRRTLATYGEVTLEAARARAREWLELLRKGVDPELESHRQRQAELRKQKNSFDAVAEEFIKRHVAKTRKAAVVERELRREFIDRWSGRPVTDITQHDVVAVIDEVVDRGAPYQARNLFGHIRTLFNWAIARGVYGIEHSPCDRLKIRALAGEKKARTRILNDEELAGLWAATDKLQYPYGPLFKLLALTGQRKSEVAEARWSEFDFAKKIWVIGAQRMKSDAPHAVPLSDAAIEILQSLPRFERGDHLFSTTFGTKAVNGFSKAKDALDRAMRAELGREPAPFCLHDIRRSVRTQLSAIPGISDLVRELVIAHARPGLHKVYDLHSYESEKRHALDAWAARLLAIVNPPGNNVVGLPRRA
jgi:integrase